MLARLSIALGGAVLLTACPSGDDDETANSMSMPSSCDAATARRGTYLVQYFERSGDCGPVKESLVRLSNMAQTVSPSGAQQCEITQAPALEDNGCTLTNSVACADAAGIVAELTIITTQGDDDGAHLSGIADVLLRDKSSARPLCKSVYDIEYTRQ
jgi:hypothetical protein